MKHVDLFSGIGGFALAARWMNWETIQFVEIDEYCQKVLRKNFPNVPIHGDIKTFNGEHLRGTVDIITGGFPCQPFSLAGDQKGTGDDRHLWPEMLRTIREIRPEWIVGENVYGITNIEGGMVFEQIFNDLEISGYQTLAVVIPACSVGRNHIRERTWFIANTNEMGRKICNKPFTWRSLSRDWMDRMEHHGWTSEPGLLRMDDGIPQTLDANRIGHLGNAIVPQVVFEIYKAIEQCETSSTS